ncbi:radical SAM/SPASM domain-containing protein [Desulfocurvibacter africanus]|uniref:radical SAM/SPASM domain-containing protein n=1 Tax=Desulfocurvibacter africanus TaxID=873 RepID=UPI00048176D2|nr:radical SAM/SPASM domain-containing protein [Desulfocurvibacter africanus]
MTQAFPDHEAVAPAFRRLPSKFFVECTTRCNLRCAMCVKQTKGCEIIEADMPLAMFERLLPAMAQADALVLNGVGESLLHPELPRMVALARQAMPQSGWIGFQSNGLLLTRERAQALLLAGLDRLCLSVDSCSPETLRQVRAGAELKGLERALAVLREAQAATRPEGSRRFEAGVEVVVSDETLDGLPELIEWVADRGASFVLASQLLPYDRSAAKGSLFGASPDACLDFFAPWRSKAIEQGLDLSRFLAAYFTFLRSEQDVRLIRFVEAMAAEAERKGIPLHLPNLVIEDLGKLDRVRETFARAEQAAVRRGLRLTLPAVSPRLDRRCDFMEDGGVFITASGDVTPCYFLWHGYSCFLDGALKRVRPKIFGNVRERELQDIWNGREFQAFRREVLEYAYPHCGSCTAAPCADILGEQAFEYDCHGVEVPCGHCPWCSGGFHCLS